MSPVYREDPDDTGRAYATASVVKTLIWAVVVVIVLFLAWRFAEFQGWVWN